MSFASVRSSSLMESHPGILCLYAAGHGGRVQILRPPAASRVSVQVPSNVTTILFTDIESSTRLWEQHRQRMSTALAGHDALARRVVKDNNGDVIKMIGDGMYAVFGDPVDAIKATLALQRALADPTATDGVPFRVRCGLHLGIVDHRDNDLFGRAVNRAARIMGAAHGGQVLISQALFEVVRESLPADVSLRDLGSIRLRDLGNPEHVYQLVHPELRREFPALRSLESTPNNLPHQVTSFIGRERELAEAKRFLEGVRLLTLTGIGGCGKTRFAIKLAEAVLPSFTDGVYFVDLAPLSDPERVPLTVATTLGIREEPDKPIVDTLCEFLSSQKMLLVLDNCEHLLAVCATLAQRLLATVPGLRILATSREGLSVSGEQTFSMQSLSLAPPGLEHDVRALEPSSEAVRLFVDRARSAVPEFELGPATASAIAEICRRLDGIPLAIELAAARVRLLSVEQIRAKLDHRFRLLTGNNNALPRHRTLRGVIEWSYENLAQDEQSVLRRLAVFAGGWTLTAATAVAGDSSDELAMIETLGQLVDKSLVVVQRDAANEPRYRILDTVREYAEERLGQASESDTIRTRHLDYYLAFAEEAKPHTYTADAAMWNRRLDAELSNLLAAHAWCDIVPDGADKGLRVVNALRRYWTDRGLFQLGMRMTKEALARHGAQRESALRANVLCGAGNLAYQQGSIAEARTYLTESLRLARAHCDRACIALVMQLFGDLAREDGDRAAAVEHFEASLAVALEIEDHRRAAIIFNELSTLSLNEGDLERASSYCERSFALCRERGLSGLPGILLTMGLIAILRGEYGVARSQIAGVAKMVDGTGSQYDGIMVLDNTAALASAVGDATRAARTWGAAEAVLKRTGKRRTGGDATTMQRLITPAIEALGEKAFIELSAEGSARTLQEALSEAQEWLGEVLEG